MEYLIGIDGGGTKTRAVLSDLDGNIVCNTEEGPSNILIVGEEGLKKVCSDILSFFLSEQKIKASEILNWTLGLAGAGRESDQLKAQRVVESLGFENRVHVTSDAHAALIGAFSGREGIIIIAGTGSICFGLTNQGELVRAGGWGYLLGDEGSGYYIGQLAIIASLRDYDKRGPTTKLRSSLEDHFKVESIQEVIPKIYQQSGEAKEEIAKLAPMVFSLADSGDEVATEIISGAAEELGDLILSVAKQMDKINGSVEVATIGSIFLQKERMLPQLRSYLGKHFEVLYLHEPELEPTAGAILLGFNKLKVRITDEILHNLKLHR